MRLIIYIAVLLSFFSCTTDRTVYSDELKEALAVLDEIVADSDRHESYKQERIKAVKSRIGEATDKESLYWIYDELYNEYNKYDRDSTSRYINLKMAIARECSNNYLILDAILDALDMYTLSGMYHEAYEQSMNLDMNILDSYGFLPRYYHIMNTLYGGLAHASDDPALRQEYITKRGEYRNMLYNFIGYDDIAKLYVKAEILIEEEKYEEAVRELEERLSRSSVTIHDKAIINYMLGVAYKKMENTEKALFHYTESSIYDISTPIRDYKSLYELAELLYETGDYERAYRYITRSIHDADTANIRINIESINSLLPIIFNSYNASMKQKNNILHILLIGISILLILLGCIVLIVVKDKRMIAATERNVRESNRELTKANERLQQYIDKLKESNEIKETYISRYIDLCSDYIGRLDKYRSELRKLSKSGGYDAIMKELRSSSVIEEELNEFYAKFDATFLDLFPDFIYRLNMLLQPDKRIEVKSKDGLLTTELRVFALIRLGVTDSVKISEFLRRSVSTIYNYRVKMRNAAVNGREDFEKEIMKIGKQP